MSIQLAPFLKDKLTHAHQILETLVLRTTEGSVFTIEIGKSIQSGNYGMIGAKVTMLSSDTKWHIGVCIGETVEQVALDAQKLINMSIDSGHIAKLTTEVPRPHMLDASESRDRSSNTSV